MWVGFLYTLIVMDPSSCGVARMSRNGMKPSCVVSSVVKLMERSIMIGREGQNMARAIKEAMYIRVNNPMLNRNIGKYTLPNIWNKVLFFHLRTNNKIKIPQCYNICASRGSPTIKTSAQKHLCLSRFNNNN